MKKHLRFTPFLFVITSFLSFQPLLSQTNNWAPIGAVWHYDAFGRNFCFFPWFEGYFTMESVRDTQMLGKTVRVIERRHGGGLKIQERDFLMYEDSGKVYYYHDSLAQFMLLYDFEAKVGDTLVLRTDTASYGFDYYHYSSLSFRVDTGWAVTISQIDTVQMAGQHRKRYVVDPVDLEHRGDYYGFWDGTVIEGIGHLGNMFGGPLVISLCDHIGKLRCYQDSNGSVNFTSRPCDYVPVPGVGIEDELAETGFRIQSSLETGSFFVAISHSQPYSQVECRLYTLTGQQVKTWARQMDNQGNWRGMVPTHELAPGSYLATLLLEGQQKAAKLVVVR